MSPSTYTGQDGSTTARPGVFGAPKFAASTSRSPGGKTLTIVGEFPYLLNDKPKEYTSLRAFNGEFSFDPDMEQIGDLAFDPLADARTQASPAKVIIASIMETVQALAELEDALSLATVRLKSRLAGPIGNTIAYTLAAGATDTLLRNLVMARLGVPQTINGLGSGPVLDVRYNGTFATKALVAVVSPLYDPVTQDATAEVILSLQKTLTGASGAVTVDQTQAAFDGPITFDPVTAPSNDVDITVVGKNRATGLADTETITLLSGMTKAVTTTKAWSGATTITVETTAYAGNITTSWVARRISKASPAPFLTNVSALINKTPGWTSTVKNARASSLRLGSLDMQVAAEAQSAAVTLRTDVFSLVRRINDTSLYAEATRVLPGAEVTWAKTGLTWTAEVTAADTGDTLTTVDPHGLSALEAVRFKLNGGTLPPELDEDTTYYVSATGLTATIFRVALTPGGVAITFSADSTGSPTVERLAADKGTGSGTGTTITLDDTSDIDVGDVLNVGKDPIYPVLTALVTAVPDAKTVTLSVALPFDFTQLPVWVSSEPIPGRPAAVTSTQFLGGGSATSPTSTTRDACYEALRATDTAVICAFSTDESHRLKALEHAQFMAGQGARECNVRAAVPAGSTLEELDAASLALNSRHISLCAQRVRVQSPGNERVWLGPEYQALMVAAAQASVAIARPLTWKQTRALDVEDGPDWNSTTNPDPLIERMITVFSRDVRGGFKVERDLTTHRANDDVAQTEPSANESLYWSIRDVRDTLLFAIGEGLVSSQPEALAGIAKARLDFQKNRFKMIKDFDPKSVVATLEDDTLRLGWKEQVVVPLNRVVVEPYVQPVFWDSSQVG